METIPFNKPYLAGKELFYISQSVLKGHISGNGDFTKKCHSWLKERYSFKDVLLTTSCTDALEMCALLMNIKPGDEIIVPSYTFVSSALAFIRQGAVIRFADSRSDHPGIDENALENLISPKTKAIVVVHYAGVATDMDKVMDLANQHGIFVVEDAAQAIHSRYKGKYLGSIGHFGTFSFHETKNIQCGEGGFLAINDTSFSKRAEILWEKGTNRAEFFRGEVNKYGWVDTGSSFLPSELTAAYLLAQLEEIGDIQGRRKDIWEKYFKELSPYEKKGVIGLPKIPEFAENNAHMFYLLFRNLEQRSEFISELRKGGVSVVFHYLPLHESSFYEKQHDGRILKNANLFSDTLVRLPLFYELSPQLQDCVLSKIKEILDKML